MIVDIHTHVLPFIDDGAQDLEMTLEMLRQMESDHITTVIATPHFNFMKDDKTEFLSKRENSINEVKRLIKTNHLNIDIKKGTELLFGPGITDLDLSDHSIEDTDYILIEFSTRKKETNIISSLEKILAQGFIPILAHMERYDFLLNDGDLMIELIQMGVLFQVNAKTIIENKSLTNILFKKNLIHLIASDSHNTTNRNPNLLEALDSINEIQAKQIIKNAQLILNNDLIEVPRPKKLIKLFNKYL